MRRRLRHGRETTLGAAAARAVLPLLLLPLVCCGCASIQLFYKEVEVIPEAPVAEPPIAVASVWPEVIKHVFSVFPFKATELEAVRGNTARGYGNHVIIRSGFLRIQGTAKGRN